MGPYDNERNGGRGRYVEADGWENGQWLVDENGHLYIIPLNDDVVQGPDDDVCDTIAGMLRDAHADALDENGIRLMGMTEVPSVLRRFSPDIGYFSA